MKLLITGALGNIGINLIPRLSEFYDLRICHHSYPKEKIDYEFMKCDVKNQKEVDEAVKEVDIILHLAAKGAKGHKSVPIKEAIEVNVIGTLNFLEAGEKYNIKKFIYTSTLHVYGLPSCGSILPEYFPIDEKHPLNPACPYGESKVLSENLLKYYSKKVKFPIVIFRLGKVMNNGINYQNFIKEQPFNEFPQFNEFFQYIDIRDLANAIKLAIESNISEYNVFNLVASDTLLYNKISTLELIKQYFPTVKIKDEEYFFTNKYTSLIDTRKIKEELGFKESFSIKSYLESKDKKEYYQV